MKNIIRNDIILRILQETYLLNAQNVNNLLTELYFRYINILDYINLNQTSTNLNLAIKQFKLLEEARTILYFIGVIFTEEFGRKAVEIRLDALEIDYLDFYNFNDRQKCNSFRHYIKFRQ